MCYKIKISVLLLFVSTSCLLHANEKKDTIQIFLPNKVVVEVVSVDVNKNKLDTAFVKEYINKFFLLSGKTNLQAKLVKSPCYIVVKPFAGNVDRYSHKLEKNAYWDITVKKRDVENKILVASDSSAILDYSAQHQFQFENIKFTVNIFFDDLKQLRELQDQRMLLAIDSVMEDYYIKKSRNIEYGQYGIKPDYSNVKINENIKYPDDQISLNLGTGIECVKNAFAPSLEASMLFSFNRKGAPKNSYGASYEWQYDFSDSYSRSINQFLNIIYSRNFSKDPEKHDTYIFRFGYLLNKNRDMYKDNTFSFSVSHFVSKYFEIAPKIYFDGAFKNFTPAVKVGISIF